MSGSNKEEEALNAVKKYIQIGSGAQNTVDNYNETSEKYDEYVGALNYSGPQQLAKAVAILLKDRFDAKILDIGAGTGLAAVELQKLGYKNIDAVDPSSGLLEVAKKRQVYGKLICQYVGQENLPLEDNSYDVAVTCGAFGENHIPKSGFRDMVRIVKPGGYLVNVFREEATRMPWYEDGLQPYLDQMEKNGVWKELSRTTFPNFIASKDGLVLIHQVL